MPMDACDSCKRRRVEGQKLQVCSGCRVAHYCSEVCQKLDWKMNHKKVCPKDGGKSSKWARLAFNLFVSVFELPDFSQHLAEKGYMVNYLCTIPNLATYMKGKTKDIRKQQKTKLKLVIQQTFQFLVQNMKEMKVLELVKDQCASFEAEATCLEPKLYLQATVERSSSFYVPRGYNLPPLGKKCVYYYVNGATDNSIKGKHYGAFGTFVFK